MNLSTIVSNIIAKVNEHTVQNSVDMLADTAASGFDTKVEQLNRFEKTDTPYILIDKIGDSFVVDGTRYTQSKGEASSELDDITVTFSTTIDAVGSKVGIGNVVVFEFNVKSIETGIPRFYSQGCGDTSGHDLSLGVNRFVRTVVDNTQVSAVLYFNGGGIGSYVVETSIKEVQTITAQPAPFDSVNSATDELLDDSVNGAATQANHNIGDTIVAGKELITNPTCDGTSGYTYVNTAETSVGGRIRLTNDVVGENGYAYEDVPTIVGETYVSSGYFFIGTQTVCLLQASSGSFGGSVSEVTTRTDDGPLYIEFVADTTTTRIHLNQASTVTGLYNEFDNVSTTLKNKVYRTIQDTVTGDLLSDTSKFLPNPNNDVTRHDPVILKDTGYEVRKGIYFYDESSTRADMATNEGWTKLGNNTYTDGTDTFAIIGYIPRLNAGAFHPVYNFYGTRGFSREESAGGNYPWYQTANLVNDTYTCFILGVTNSITGYTDNGGYIGSGGGSFHSDGRFYDKLYNGGEGGLIQFGYCYSKDDVDADIESGKLLSAKGIKTGSVMSGAEAGITEIYPTNASTTDITYSNLGAVKVGDSIKILRADDSIIESTIVLVGNDYVRLDTTFSRTLGEVYKSISTWRKSETHTTKYTQLTTDLIGDPDLYDSSIKTALISDNGLHFSPRLVNNDGSSAIPVDNTGVTYDLTEKNLDGNGFRVYKFQTAGVLDSSWSSGAETTGLSNSEITSVDGIILHSYNSANEPVYEALPQEVIKAIDKVFAQNSHSVYKGGLITKAVTGKVAVGNGSNGLESKYLENIYLQGYDYKAKASDETHYEVNAGTVVLVLSLDETGAGTFGKVYERLTTSFTNTLYNQNYSNTTNWKDLGWYIGDPQHNAIQLDNEDSPACKWFYALSVSDDNEYCIDVYGKEIPVDPSIYKTWIHNGTSASSQGINDEDVVVIAGSNNTEFNGKTFILTSSSASFSNTTMDGWYIQDGRVMDGSYNLIGYLLPYSGGFFADNGKFDDLSTCYRINLGVWKK